MKSAQVSAGNTIKSSQYNDLREDAKKAGDLLAHEQGTPDLTLYVETGVFYIGATRAVFAGGNSPSFTAPASNPRIDLLTIDSAGTLARVAGTEAASPSVPAYPYDKIVICEVYNRVGQTTVRDVNTASQGYILKDTRPFVKYVSFPNVAQFADGVITDIKLASVFVIASPSVDQTINNIVTFSSIPVLPASDPTADNQFARKSYIDAKI